MSMTNAAKTYTPDASHAAWSPFDQYFTALAAEELLDHLHGVTLNRETKRAASALADAIGLDEGTVSRAAASPGG